MWNRLEEFTDWSHRDNQKCSSNRRKIYELLIVASCKATIISSTGDVSSVLKNLDEDISISLFKTEMT